MSRAPLRAISVAALVAAMLTIPATAGADHLDVDTEAPSVVAPGGVVEVRVVLRDSGTGLPVPGATVVATREATIVGVTGQVVLGSATTDELGRAAVRWQQRAEGGEAVVVAYGGSGDTVLESQPFTVLTSGTARQIVRGTAGVRIPGLGAWVLLGVMALVWGIIQFALVGPIVVARRYAEPAEPEP